MGGDVLDREFDEIGKELETGDRVRDRRAARRQELPPLSLADLCEILTITIKEDRVNKAITFLCCMSAYTEESQFNISFNAPSATGKSYIPLEVTSLFPRADVIKVGYCSPTAFFHDTGVPDPESGCIVLDLERKILVFLDQPHTDLLQRLRPLLSHDQKEICVKITDRKEKRGLRTKNAVLRGYPSVIFCTAGLTMDEQEATRFILLSPETSQLKIRKGIEEALIRESDPESYIARVNQDPRRRLLIRRIEAIKEERISVVRIPDPEAVRSRFLSEGKVVTPRSQRDVKRVFSLIKSHALLNLWHRESPGDLRTILATSEDIEAGLGLWEKIARCQELSIPPYILQLFADLIVPCYRENNDRLTRKDILRAHYQLLQRPLRRSVLDKEIIPMLEMAGLITQEVDPTDSRVRLIVPVLPDEEDPAPGPGDEDDREPAVG